MTIILYLAFSALVSIVIGKSMHYGMEEGQDAAGHGSADGQPAGSQSAPSPARPEGRMPAGEAWLPDYPRTRSGGCMTETCCGRCEQVLVGFSAVFCARFKVALEVDSKHSVPLVMRCQECKSSL